ncbi:hypothetical protein [Pseudarthrobacter sp. H2]|uniref:hypothetical protein n=1 Tax=Pseudarthrobacter sp. H2 TaxID=3418415 RepID=UPI003CF25DA8
MREKKTVDTTSRQVSDWSGLAGQTVLVKHQGETVRTGRVEVVARDAAMLWLEKARVLERKLYSKAEGYVMVRVDLVP